MSSYVSVEEVEESFQQEVSLMAFFNDRPEFAKLIGFSMEKKIFAMKYYPLGSLYDAIKKGIPNVEWTPKLIRNLCRDVASGLQLMHENDFIHNDIKVILNYLLLLFLIELFYSHKTFYWTRILKQEQSVQS